MADDYDYNIIHFMHMQTKRPICNTTAVDPQMGIDIDKIDCIKCLRALVKDAGRYGNGRHPKR